MTEFMMIFRTEQSNEPKPSPEEMQNMIKQWQDWIGGIAAQGKFVATNALLPIGKSIRANGIITDGPYAEVKEFVGGYLIAKAENIDDAMALTTGCPTLENGGIVEVRAVMALDM